MSTSLKLIWGDRWRGSLLAGCCSGALLLAACDDSSSPGSTSPPPPPPPVAATATALAVAQISSQTCDNLDPQTVNDLSLSDDQDETDVTMLNPACGAH
jgi:hypothetical protein